MNEITGAILPTRGPRLFHDFTIPESLRFEGGAAMVSFKLLSADEELTVSRLGRYDVLKTESEAAKMAIVQLDGKDQDPSTGRVDEFWEKGGPKLRSLLLRAYQNISSPTVAEEKSFFDSQKRRVE